VVVRKEIIYYTDNRLDEKVMAHCQKQLLLAGLPIVSSSLQSIDFGRNKVFEGKRSFLTLWGQIVDCLERSDADVVFFCEHDVVYHMTHFEFTPPKDNVYYYNQNVWKWNGFEAVKYDCRWLSQMCCYRKIALEHYIKTLELELLGHKKYPHNRAEPGTRRTGKTDYKTGRWSSEFPNIDIRHGGNLTGVSRFNMSEFKSKPKNFQKKYTIESYGDIL